MSNFVTVKHSGESAHRLYAIPGKCKNLHGHSFNYELTVTGDLREDVPVIVEFGQLKKDLRWFVDTYLDHGTMLGIGDPLLSALVDDGGKLFIFGNTKWEEEAELGLEGYAADLLWPTVEAVAILVARVMRDHFGYDVTEVTVSETSVNTATWKKD